MKTNLTKILTALALVAAWPALSENYTGKILPLEGTGPALYNFSRSYSAQGDKSLGVGEYKSLDGKVLVREDTVLSGTKVLSHAIQQKQTNESGKLTVEGGKLHFSYTRDGKEKTAEEDSVDNLVVSASLVPYIQAHWAEIVGGKTVSIRYAALDRRETVGFDLFQVKDDTVAADLVTVKMKPSSFIIAALVNPLFLSFDPKTHALKEMRGRTAPKVLNGSSWKDQDAHTVYELVK